MFMKTIMQNKITLIGTFILMIISRSAICQVTPQDPTSLIQDFTIGIDKLGDAKVEVSQKMNATQWENFRQSPLMTDVSIAKRNLENSMATYDVEDFKRDIDELNRISKISVTIKAYAQYNGNGDWELKTDQKNPQVEKLTDKEYMITGNTLMNGQLVQQNLKIFFPDGARSVKQTTDAFGKAKFAYQLGGGFTSFMSWNNILGVLLILSSAVFFVRMSKSPSSPTLKPAPKQ